MGIVCGLKNVRNTKQKSELRRGRHMAEENNENGKIQIHVRRGNLFEGSRMSVRWKDGK